MECEYCKKETPEPKIEKGCELIAVCCKECRDRILNNMQTYADNFKYENVFTNKDK